MANMTPPAKKRGTGGKLPPWMPESASSPAPGKKPAAARPAGQPGKPGKKAAGKPARSGKPGPAGGGRGPKPFQDGRGPKPSAGGRGRGAGPGADDPFAAREARKYEQPITSREAIADFLSNSDGPLTAEDLATALELTAPDRFDALTRRLNAMVRDGQLLMNRRGGYAAAKKLDLIAGTVIANPDGFGFLKAEDGGEDLFLPPAEMRKALHGDRVLASVTNIDRRGRREGAIVEVLEHRLTRLTGRYSERSRIGMVVPDDRRVLTEVLIPPEDNNGAREGQLVVVEITQPPEKGRPPVGRILLVLGDRLTPSLVVQAAIHGHDLPHEFPREALAESQRVHAEVGRDDGAVGERQEVAELRGARAALDDARAGRHLLVAALDRLLGVGAGSIEWGYLNSGVHDSQRDHEFDRATVRTIVESVTALDAALEALINR